MKVDMFTYLLQKESNIPLSTGNHLDVYIGDFVITFNVTWPGVSPEDYIVLHFKQYNQNGL